MRFPSGILPQLWVSGLRDVTNPGNKTFKDWLLTGGGYAVTDLPNAATVEILVHHEPDFLRPSAFEINIWASSAFETITSITTEAVRNKAIAWPLIQLYYSAFFSAHSLMRAFGRICTQLGTLHTTAILASASATGTPGTLDNGLYAFTYDRSLTTLRGAKLADSHADTWRTFSSVVNALSADVLAISAATSTRNDASECFVKLNEVLTNYGSAPIGNWLSQFRNRANYQREFGVWYPYSGASPSLEDLHRLIARWKEAKPNFNFVPGASEVLRFTEACVFIVALCRRTILELSEFRASKAHFVDRGGIDYLRFAQFDGA